LAPHFRLGLPEAASQASQAIQAIQRALAAHPEAELDDLLLLAHLHRMGQVLYRRHDSPETAPRQL
jgi:hypothetical protein